VYPTVLKHRRPRRPAPRLAGALACLLSLHSPAAAQSLGAVAAKERDRREKVRQTGGVSPTLTDADLQTTKGQLANDPGAPAAPSGGREGAPESGGPAARVAPPADSSASTAAKEAYWRGRFVQARNRVEEAQRRHDAFQLMIRFGQASRTDENGRRVIYSAQQLKQMADAAEAELASARKAFEDLLEEGRRAGALPGWLR
jgi:hypothetical protein